MNLERSILTLLNFFDRFIKAFYWTRSANDNRKEKRLKITYRKDEFGLEHGSLECSNSKCSNFKFSFWIIPVLNSFRLYSEFLLSQLLASFYANFYSPVYRLYVAFYRCFTIRIETSYSLCPVGVRFLLACITKVCSPDRWILKQTYV